MKNNKATPLKVSEPNLLGAGIFCGLLALLFLAAVVHDFRTGAATPYDAVMIMFVLVALSVLALQTHFRLRKLPAHVRQSYWRALDRQAEKNWEHLRRDPPDIG